MAQGYTRQQELEYLYRYSFYPSKFYGDPGLEFIETNIQAIDKQLREGLKGKEIQYYNNGQLIKSKLFYIIRKSVDQEQTAISLFDKE
jgi:hypothetical protein